MPVPYRIAIVGAGMISRASHLPAALGLPVCRVAAIIDPELERARGLASAYGIEPKLARNVADVFDDVDGVLIATPNDTHHEIALACLRAGVHTLIEKPLATTIEEGEAIVAEAARRNCIVAVGYVTRFRENVALLGELLRQEHFGAVRRFVHQFGTPGGWAPFSAYNLNARRAGGGVLVVTGTHFLDRMLHFWGFPHQLDYRDDAQGGPEANCEARFQYGSGASRMDGLARYSKTTRLPAGLVIETEQGIVRLDDTDDAEIVFRPHGQSKLESVVRRHRPATAPAGCLFQRQLLDFIAASSSGGKPLVDGREALESLRLIEALYARRQVLPADWYPVRECLSSES